MDNEDEELGKLFEALSNSPIFEEPVTPEFQSYSKWPSQWNYWGRPYPCINPGNHRDVLYKDKKGKLHRIYGPAYASTRFDIEEWWKDGKRHRVDGPAHIHKNNMVWFYEGLLHRLDGPAVIDGAGPKQYWIMGQRMSEKEYKKEIARRKRKGLIK